MIRRNAQRFKKIHKAPDPDMAGERDEILVKIDYAVAPGIMSQREALDFLEDLSEQIEERCELLRAEIING